MTVLSVAVLLTVIVLAGLGVMIVWRELHYRWEHSRRLRRQRLATLDAIERMDLWTRVMTEKVQSLTDDVHRLR